MNIKVDGKKVDPFSVGNPTADLGDTIVGTYGRGQCEQVQPPFDADGACGPIPILPPSQGPSKPIKI